METKIALSYEEKLESAEKAFDLETLENSSIVVLLQLDYMDKEDLPNLRRSGIIIPNQAKQGGSTEVFEATVLVVGDKVKRVVPGDMVVFGQNHFSTINRNGIEFLLMAAKDIIMKVKKEKSDD